MRQRITFVATVDVDREGLNWQTAQLAVEAALLGSGPDVRVTRVIKLEIVEGE